MVWTTQQQLAQARLEPTINPDSLYAKAEGLVPQGKDADLMSNKEFVDTLVANGKITSSQGNLLLDTVKRGVQLTTDPLFRGDLNSALLFSSLPETYAYQDIAVMLCKTGQLSNPDTVKKRLSETQESITRILGGMLEDSGCGLNESYLLGRRHDVLSRFLGSVSPPPPNNLINQVSLAYTLLTFSATPFAAFLRVDDPLPDATERQQWLRMWNVIGSLMGIGDQGLPMTDADAQGLLTLIQQSPPYANTEQGETLMNTLLGAFPEKQAFCTYSGGNLMYLLGINC